MTQDRRITEFRREYYFLSNFYRLPRPMTYLGLSFPTSEHAFAAAKTCVRSEQVAISTARTPGTAKWMGRNVALVDHWKEISKEVMAEIVAIKFDDQYLLAKLLATGEADLVEGNYWGDTYWGVDLRTGAGENVLGKILMAHRRAMAALGERPGC